MPELAAVLVDQVNPGTNRVFTYSIPPELAARVRCGTKVKVPFQQRYLTGYVTPEPAPAVPGLRPIAAVLAEDLFTPQDWELVRWLAGRYLCHLVEALRLILPPQVRNAGPTERRMDWVVPTLAPQEGRALLRELERRAPAQARLLSALLAAPEGMPRARLLKEQGAGPESLKALIRRGAVALREEGPALEEEACGHELSQGKLPELNPAQAQAVSAITAAIRDERFEAFLLHGVTGSGKTEVYLRALAAALEKGKGGIVLVPEIALTPQTLERFSQRFGSEVAVLHSGLSARVRYAEWERIRQGRARVVIGARSALFAPLRRTGVIILDEEQEPAYKQEENPRYLAREVAIFRARQDQAALVLGSATPAVETYFQAEQGRYRLLALPKRVGGRPLPEVQVVDMRAELMAGNRSIFSRALTRALDDVLRRGEQAILFLNRRGYSTFVLCRQCGLVAACPHCDLALTLHNDSRRLVCHHCGFTREPYRTCPRCGSRLIRDFGCGTERVEAEVARLFPAARVLRLDGDTAGRRGAYDEILGAFSRHKADVLVGTQMVAKGLDFTRVSLIGIISADLALHLPDPYAWERTFQLLEQVAGRAGRGEVPGRVVLQTYTPDHPSIACAKRHAYLDFYRIELSRRARYRYPPYSEVVLVRAAAPAEEAARRLLADLVARLGPLEVEVEGPAPCPLLKVGDHFRWQVIFKGTDLECLRRRLAEELPAMSAAGQRMGARLSVDVDPVSYL
ncbi:MAG: hypothetical protein PWQ41_990 [Bacillota bacterium]|nr:hypothetical protein [Bacillota bacterium]MDK2855072.1 hypothetical protein [Bacillota bacterium]MDK2925216.1 hypothetical protein [Bacillota bacterium]